MILRKPYAVFIKYFKLIHLLLAVGNVYLVYRMIFALNFLNEAISQPRFNLVRNINIDLIDVWMYLIPIFVILVSIMVLGVLVYKQKPFRNYVIITVAFLIVLMFTFYLADYFKGMELKVMTSQSLSLMRDFVTLCVLLEIITSIKFLVTGIGFDIKSFDFGKDLAELEIEEIDREEFEVEFKFDFNKLRRDTSRNIRIFKYSYLENKFKYNVIFFFCFIFIFSIILSSLKMRIVAFNEGDLFFGREFSVKVNQSHLTTKNYRGIEIVDNSMLLVVDLDIASVSGKEEVFNLARVRLEIGNFSFYHLKKYRDSLVDLGIVYDDQKVGSEFVNYILVFEVPKDFVTRPVVFKYVDNLAMASKRRGPSIQSFLLNPNNINGLDDIYTTQYGEKMYFREPILISSLSVDSFNLSEEVKLTYQFCIETDDCFLSEQFLRPAYAGNDQRIVMSLKGDFTTGDDVNHFNINYFDFLKRFGELNYEVEGIKKRFSFDREVKSTRVNTGNNVYIEVPSEVMNADKIELWIKIRNYHYRHILK